MLGALIRRTILVGEGDVQPGVERVVIDRRADRARVETVEPRRRVMDRTRERDGKGGVVHRDATYRLAHCAAGRFRTCKLGAGSAVWPDGGNDRSAIG